MRETLTVGTAVAKPGESAWGEIPVPAKHAESIRPPLVALVNGPVDGPIVYVGAGAHGDEFNGIEAARRAAIALDPRAVRGAVIFVPVQNRAAFEARRRRTPGDDGDLDESYPGDPNGSPTEVLAHLLFEHAVVKAACVLDLHAATRGGWNLLRASTAPSSLEASARAERLARAFGARVIVARRAPAHGPLGATMGWNLDRALYVQVAARNLPALGIEFGEAGRLDVDQVELALRGITGVLAEFGVLDGAAAPRAERPTEPILAHDSVAIRCATGGFLYLLVQPGERVQPGQLLARVVSFPDDAEEIRSPRDGIVVRVATDGVVAPAERIVVLATD